MERAPEVSAVLGGEEARIFMISSMVDEFEGIVAASLSTPRCRTFKFGLKGERSRPINRNAIYRSWEQP